ncbi:MAG: hypothetical protein ABSG85_08725 [Spirochaetia bacterium]
MRPLLSLVQRWKAVRWSALALLVVLGLGALNIPYPFSGDQALFSLGASELRNGGRLYIDFWDIKQPGVFWFYYVGGLIFGITEEGIHVFELLYWALFAICFLAIARRDLRDDSLAAAGLVLAVGTYYAVAGPLHLTQLEMLVSLPLLFGVWLVSAEYRSWRTQRLGFCLAGLMGAVVVTAKLMMALILLAVLVNTLVSRTFRSDRRDRSASPLDFALLIAGLFAPLAAVWLWWRAANEVSVIYDTFVILPLRILDVPTARAPLGRLGGSVTWFLTYFSIPAAFGVGGAILSLKQRGSLFRMNLALWVVTGGLVILLQRASWWEYQMLLLLVPLGYLSPLALRRASSGYQARTVILACALVLMIPAFGRIVIKSLDWRYALERGGTRPALAYKRHESPTYDAIYAGDEFLRRADAQAGPIAVLGDPLHIYLAGRRQATSINGWALELYPEEQWTALFKQLDRARPAYVFVARDYEELISTRKPEIWRLLAASYRRREAVSDGVWYEREFRSLMNLLPTD